MYFPKGNEEELVAVLMVWRRDRKKERIKSTVVKLQEVVADSRSSPLHASRVKLPASRETRRVRGLFVDRAHPHGAREPARRVSEMFKDR